MLTALKELFSSHKIATIASTLTAFFALTGGLWAFDGHYAKAAEVESSVKELTLGQRLLSVDVQLQFNRQSSRELKSKINDIEDRIAAGKKVDQVELNRKRRLEQDLEELKVEANRLERQKFELQKR